MTGLFKVCSRQRSVRNQMICRLRALAAFGEQQGIWPVGDPAARNIDVLSPSNFRESETVQRNSSIYPYPVNPVRYKA